MQCKICYNSKNNTIYTVREMMFGNGDYYTYFECSECGCLQISEIPGDISALYPPEYYSFHLQSPEASYKGISSSLKKIRNRFAILKQGGITGHIIYRIYPNEIMKMLHLTGITQNSKILDIGCGSGVLLYDLQEIGFQKLLGVDPFINDDIVYSNGLKIVKKNISEISGKWKLIMFHHSFEHIPDPFELLSQIPRLLSDDGVCLIRIPTVSSYAWKHYRENWVQLDAPRHFFLYSIESIRILAEKSNLKIDKIIYDSNELQFWGSEQYIRDIAFTDPRSYFKNPGASIFNSKEIKLFRKKSKKLNEQNQGDSIGVFLKLK